MLNKPVRCWKLLLTLPLLAAAWVAGHPASAQTQLSTDQKPPLRVYTYVEQMPTLPGGGGQAAIVEAVQKNVVYPARNEAEGLVFVKFIVLADGSVTGTQIVKGLDEACDKAVLAAVGRLPRFVPGKQNGRQVAVTFTVPSRFGAR